MHLASILSLGAVAALVAVPARANLELAQKNSCTACHAVDRKVVGPAYQEVARKYAGQPDAVARLTQSIRSGGSGRWGQVPMPAQAQLPEADAAALAQWVLSGGK